MTMYVICEWENIPFGEFNGISGVYNSKENAEIEIALHADDEDTYIQICEVKVKD